MFPYILVSLCISIYECILLKFICFTGQTGCEITSLIKEFTLKKRICICRGEWLCSHDNYSVLCLILASLFWSWNHQSRRYSAPSSQREIWNMAFHSNPDLRDLLSTVWNSVPSERTELPELCNANFWAKNSFAFGVQPAKQYCQTGCEDFSKAQWSITFPLPWIV